MIIAALLLASACAVPPQIDLRPSLSTRCELLTSR